jgi:hypothetical protein
MSASVICGRMPKSRIAFTALEAQIAALDAEINQRSKLSKTNFTDYVR